MLTLLNLTAGLFSGKNLCVCWLFLLVLLSRSEVAKTFIAESFPYGSEASPLGTTHNSHHLQVRVERVVRVASLLDNPFIHGNPNMSTYFRCTVGYPSFRIQTLISVIYSPKDLFLLPIKCWFDGFKHQFYLTQYLLGRCYSRRNTKIKLLLQTFLYISAMFWVGKI